MHGTASSAYGVLTGLQDYGYGSLHPSASFSFVFSDQVSDAVVNAGISASVEALLNRRSTKTG